MHLNDDALLEKIEDYLRGKLPSERAADFARQIAADPQLAETVEAMRFVHAGIERSFRDDLRAKLEAWDKAAPMSALATASPPRNSSQTWWLIAVLLGVLAAGGILFFGTKSNDEPSLKPEPPAQNQPVADSQTPPEPATQQPDNQSKRPGFSAPKASPRNPKFLATATEAYAEPADLGSGQLMSPTPNKEPKNALSRGIAHYHKSQFAQAAEEFGKIQPGENPAKFAPAQRWMAHTRYHLGEFEKAAAIFKAQVEQNTQDAQQDEAEWYWLLCLVPDYPKHKARADALLQKMTDPRNAHAYQKPADSLRQRLLKISEQ